MWSLRGGGGEKSSGKIFRLGWHLCFGYLHFREAFISLHLFSFQATIWVHFVINEKRCRKK